MTGLNVMHCTPGDLGKLPEWKAIIPYAATLDQTPLDSGNPVFNALWISPFCQTTDAFTFNKRPRQGSLYATRDHFAVDSLFSNVADDHPDKKTIDEKHLRKLCDDGARRGIRLCADLVINHVASDHALVIREDNDIKAIKQWGCDIRVIVKTQGQDIVEKKRGTVALGETVIALSYASGDYDALPGEPMEKGRKIYDLRFAYDAQLEPIVDSSLGQSWSDVRKINYRNDRVRGEFVDLWKRQITWFMGLGFTGFRCDAAYKIGRQVWSDLVQHAYDDYKTIAKGEVRNTFKEPVWIAETLGGDWTQIRDNLGAARIKTSDGGERKAFDYGMLGTHWWDGRDTTYIDQSKALAQNTRFGGLGVADNHDTKETLAAAFARQCKPEAVSDICFRDFVQSIVLGAAGVCMEYGYETCVEEQASIFREPEIFEKRRRVMAERGSDHVLNLNKRLRAVLNYLDQMKAMGLSQQFNRADFATSLGKHNDLMQYTIDLTDQETGEKKGSMVVIIHARPEKGYDLIEDTRVLNCNHEHVHRLVLGSGDAEILADDDGDKSFLKVHDLAIYTDLPMDEYHPHESSVSVRNLPQRVLV